MLCQEKVPNYIIINNKKQNNKKIKNVGTVKEKYLVIKKLEEIYYSFYSVIIGNQPNQLDIFIENYNLSVLNIDQSRM